MRSLGMWLVIFGVGSFALDAMGRELVILSWIDRWGHSAGNVIRVAMALAGAGIWLAASRQRKASA